jgi:hypothetical protein
MPTMFTTLPAPFALQPDEEPCLASAVAPDLVTLAAEAAEDAEPMLAQLGAAPDVTPEAVALGVILRNLLSQAAAVADQLVAATGEAG